MSDAPGATPSTALVRLARAAVRARFVLLALWLAALAVAARQLPRLEFEFSLHPLLKGGDEKVEEVREFYRTFPPAEGHAVVTASWDETLTVERLRRAARWGEALEALPEVREVYSPARLLEIEFQGFTVDEWARLGGTGDEPIELGDAPGMGTIRGRFVSDDLRSVAFHVRKARGVSHRQFFEALDRECASWGHDDLRVLGRDRVLEEMVANLRGDLVDLLAVELAALLVILPVLLRSFRRAYLPLAVAGTGLIVFCAVLAAADRPIGLIYLAAPVLIVVIGLSDAIHLQQRFDEARARGAGVAEALVGMLRSVGAACVLTSLTTAIGFLSLVFARHEEVRHFGLWCAAGVGIAFLVVVLFLPVALIFVPGRCGGQPGWVGFRLPAAGMRRWALPVAVVLGGVAVGTVLVRVDTALTQELPPGTPSVRDLAWFAENFHGTDRVEVEVRGPLDDPAVFAAVGELQEALEGVDEVVGSSSYVDAVRFMLPAGIVETRDGPYLGLRALGGLGAFPGNLLTRDADRACVVFYTSHEFGSHQFRAFQDRFAVAAARFPAQADVRITGYVPMAYESVNLITDTLIRSFLLSLAAITLVLAVALRSVPLALLCLVPNALPILVASGVLGWTGIPLRIGVVIVFCVGLGLAVDDTIHLIVRFRQLGRSDPGGRVRDHLDESVRSSGFAIVLTSVVLLVASVAFLRSEFSTMRDTGILLGVITTAALLADLFVFPWLIERAAGWRAVRTAEPGRAAAEVVGQPER